MKRIARPQSGVLPRYALAILAVTGCCYTLYFDQLGVRDLWASHEARAAQNAQAMLDDGTWLFPRRYDGSPELQKPPLYYWCVAAFGWVRGRVDATAVRLPSTLAALATIALVVVYLFRRGRPQAALVAGVALATAHHFTWIGRTGRIDVPLTATTTAAVLCLRQTDSRARVIAGNLAVVAGVLLKGPLGAVLPGVVLAVERAAGWAEGSESRRIPFNAPPVRGGPRSPRPTLRGLLVFTVLCAAWFVYAHFVTEGEFTRVFFWHHHVQRAAGGSETLAAHPWWFYAARVAVDWLPWSPLLGLALLCYARRPDFRVDREARLGLVWLVAIVGLLSLSRFKRADYLLPAYPGAAILLGCWAERLPAVAVRRCAFGALAACSVGWAVFVRTQVASMDAEREKHTFAATIRAVAPPPEHVLFFRVEDHLLAFHVGRPVSGLLEWENLDVWVAQPGARHVVMPADCAAEWRSYISSGGLDELARWTDRSDRRRPRDLVLVRTRRNDASRHDDVPRPTPQALARRDQPAAARSQRGGDVGGGR